MENWDEINDSILGLNEYIQQYSANLEILYKVAEQISSREYDINNYSNIRQCNNAIEENKIKNCPIQQLLVNKLLKLELTDDLNCVYQNIPSTIEECNQYLSDLKEKYKLGIKIIKLLNYIEIISETEYQPNSSFEETTYAKLIDYENEKLLKVFSSIINNNGNIEMINICVNKILEHIKSLSLEERKELVIQFLSLSYDRNSFNYISASKLYLRANKNLKLYEIYGLYHFIIYKSMINTLMDISIDKWIDNFDEIIQYLEKNKEKRLNNN